MADADDIEEWTVNANEVVHLSLVNEAGISTEFPPTFTYPIYGNKELIYGYKNLSIDIKFDERSLLPFVNVSYDGKLPDAGEDEDVKIDDGETNEGGGDDEDTEDTPHTDPLKQLLKFMDKDDTIFTSSEDSTTHQKDQLNLWNETRKQPFQIPGTLLNTFTINSNINATTTTEAYKLFKTTLKEANLLHKRLQLFVLLFIEAGSYIDITDDRWELYILYKVDENNEPKEFVGFTTVYPYFWYSNGPQHDSELTPNAIRKRISQFVILPPFQGKSLGAHLYNSLIDEFLLDKDVREITVEDPSEAFDDLRDRCDLERLYKIGKIWPELKLPLDSEWVSKSRQDNKMAPRQFDRCLEMALLQKFSPGKPDKKYRLYVKNRLYIRNREALSDLDSVHQIDKLHETYLRLIEDYERIMKKVSFQTDRKGKKRAFSETT